MSRLVIDPGRLLSIAGGALRLPALATNAWGNLGISYGPFNPRPGLGLAWRLRLGDVDRWPDGDSTKFVAGWFDFPNPTNPVAAGKGFVFRRGLDGVAGMLAVKSPAGAMPLISPVMQIDAQLFAFFRSDSVLLYAASARGVPGFGAYPMMRPVGLLPLPGWRSTFASLLQKHQRDPDHPTVLEGVRVALVPEFSGWAGSAVFAEAEPAGPGRSPSQASAGNAGASLDQEDSHLARGGRFSMTHLSAPAGLVAAVVETGDRPGGIDLFWRWKDHRNHWRAEITQSETRLVKVVNGRTQVIATEARLQPEPGSTHRYWVTDDGLMIQVWRDEAPLLWALDGMHGGDLETGVRLVEGATSRVHHFEVHLRAVPIPTALLLGAPYERTGKVVVAADELVGTAAHLAGRRTPKGSLRWQRHGGPDFEQEFIALIGGRGARATRENSSLLGYLLDWPDPGFADVACELTSPAAPLVGHGGLILWQDDRNFLASFWDSLDGRHGVWCTRDGHWVPVEVSRIGGAPGSTQRIRLTCDGDNYALIVDEQPILLARISDVFRDPSPLQIRMVGIVVGRRDGRGDLGTLFQKFEARH